MNKKDIILLQRRLITLLKKLDVHKSLSILCKDSCSEISRLVGYWIIKDHPKATILILKGDNVFNTKKSHDIVLIEENNEYFLIDPTIWQFFKRKRNILIGEVNSTNEALILANSIYKGKWKVSERIEKYSEKESKKLEKIIKLNVQ
jgi:hypothetical protein